MPDLENFAEIGDFFVEYSDCYLGSGSAVWDLTPQAQEVRRDLRNTVRRRSVNNIKWHLNIKLNGGEQFWNLFDTADKFGSTEFARQLFTGGGELKLFPVDTASKGFLFFRCYLEKIARYKTQQLSSTLELDFSCEPATADGSFFQRIPTGKLPANAPKGRQVDIAAVNRKILELIGNELKITPGKELNQNFFAPSAACSYMLKLNNCSECNFNAPSVFDYTLACRMMPENKTLQDNKLYTMAVNINNRRILSDSQYPMWCKVKNLDFDGVKVVNGSTYFESFCKFSLIELS